MNRSARRRRSYADLERDLAEQKEKADQMVALANILLTHAGGTLVIPTVEALAATEHSVYVDVGPDNTVFKLVGYEKPKGRIERLRLALPGRA